MFIKFFLFFFLFFGYQSLDAAIAEPSKLEQLKNKLIELKASVQKLATSLNTVQEKLGVLVQKLRGLGKKESLIFSHKEIEKFWPDVDRWGQEKRTRSCLCKSDIKEDSLGAWEAWHDNIWMGLGEKPDDKWLKPPELDAKPLDVEKLEGKFPKLVSKLNVQDLFKELVDKMVIVKDKLKVQHPLSYCGCGDASSGNRLIFVLRFLDAVFERYPPEQFSAEKPFVHTEFGEEGGMQTYLHVYGLWRVGYKNIICNVITLGADPVVKIKSNLESKENVVFKFYKNGVDDYINDAQAQKSHSFAAVDVECDIKQVGDVSGDIKMKKDFAKLINTKKADDDPVIMVLKKDTKRYFGEYTYTENPGILN